MYAVAFKSQDNKQLDLSVVGDAGYALILPWMPVPVSMITLTQVVSGSSTVVARAAIGREIPDLKHLALTVDGTTAKVYFRGRLLMVGTLSTTMTIDRVELQGGSRDTLLSEMLLMPRVAEPEDIAMWHNLRAPFYDPSPHIPAEHQPVTVKGAGADIDIDKYGIRATRKADNVETFRVDTETGDAFFKGDITGASGTFSGRIEAEEGYFRGDITGATGTFSGHLSAERIIEGIEVYGGLSADHIKAGEISYDKLNVAFAKVTHVQLSGILSNGTTAQLIHSAESQDDRNKIRLNLKAGDEPFLQIFHNPLKLIAGLPIVFAGVLDLGFPIEPRVLGDWTIAVEGVYADFSIYKFELRPGRGDQTTDLLFQRHAIA